MTNQINRSGQSEERNTSVRCQRELKVKTAKLPKARENAGDRVMIGVSFAFNWLREWRKFSLPIRERIKAKPMQSRITFEPQLKTALTLKF